MMKCRMRSARRFSETRAREGDFVETCDGLFFDVKGVLHPPGKTVAYLRYYPDARGSRFRDGQQYAKVYELSERNRLIKKRWPQYLYYDEIQGRHLQGVPKRYLLRLHKPEQRLASIFRSRRRDQLEKSAAGLIEALARKSKLPLRNFGVTGSLLVRLHSRSSDIDVVAYGIETAKHLHKTLIALLEEDEYFHAYHEHDLNRLYVRRSMQNSLRFEDFKEDERRKVFQGKFMSHDYFLRCVKSWNEITEVYGRTTYRPAGRSLVSARVVNDTETLLTPCTYQLDQIRVLQGDALCSPREVVSFRGRFTEQAHKGEKVIARGRIESVHSGPSHYFRLVVGEERTDMLRTVRSRT